MVQKIINQLIRENFMFTFFKLDDSVQLDYYQGDNIGEPIIQATIEDCIKVLVDQLPGIISSENYLKLNANQPEAVPEEIQAISIDHPFFTAFKQAINGALQNAVQYTDQNTTATVSTKLEVNEKYNAPEFANNAKLISPVEFTVGLATKRDFSKIKGSSKEFVARMVDGHMLLVDPDRQMSLDDLDTKEPEEEDDEEEGGKDAFFDPDNAAEGEVVEYHAGDEEQIGIDDADDTDEDSEGGKEDAEE